MATFYVRSTNAAFINFIQWTQEGADILANGQSQLKNDRKMIEKVLQPELQYFVATALAGAETSATKLCIETELLAFQFAPSFMLCVKFICLSMPGLSQFLATALARLENSVTKNCQVNGIKHWF